MGSIEHRRGVRHELKRDSADLFIGLAGEGFLFVILLVAIVASWGILPLLILAVVMLVFWVVTNWAFRLQNYVILHDEHVDVKQVPWSGDELGLRKIPYRSILHTAVDGDQLLLHLGDPSSGVQTVTFRPVDARRVESEIRSRIEAAQSTKQVADR